MEDEVFISPGFDFVGLFDGHGGGKVSNYLKRTLYSSFLQGLPSSGRWSVNIIKHSLRKALQKCDDEVGLLKQWNHQGSTAVVVVVHKGVDDVPDETTRDSAVVGGDSISGQIVDESKDSLICLNVGDSRAILARDGIAVELSEDHKPERDDERQRIEKLGGSVKWHGLLNDNNTPIARSGCYRINGNLALSRAVGDHAERPFVSSTPDLSTEVLNERDEFICIGTDGLWDVFGSQELVTFILRCKDAIIGMPGSDSSQSSSRSKTNKFPLDRREIMRAVSSFHKRFINNKAEAKENVPSNFKSAIPRLVVDAALKRGSSDNISCAIIWLT